MTRRDSRMGRRQMLAASTAAAGLAGLSSLAPGVASGAELPVEPSEDHDRAPAAVLEVLAEGTCLGAWTVERVHAPRMGAIPVTMRIGERRFQLDVMQRGSDAVGVAETETLAIFVSNEGDGTTETDELEGRGALVLAHHLASRPVHRFPALLTHGQRAATHPGGRYHVPRT